MKKLIFALVAIVIMANTSFAQMKDAPKQKDAKEAAAAPKKDAGQKLKKDGTPDMRYKDNKEAAAAKPAGPMKKDGTPDMRHKANKEAAAAKTSEAKKK